MRKLIFTLLTISLLLAIYRFLSPHLFSKNSVFEISGAIPTQVDVVISGAGTGGISAAIQAARQGAKVLLLEETDYIGGQMTAAGVTSMDGNTDWRYGIYKEFTDKIITHYQSIGKSVATCYWNNKSICFEPHIGRQILQNMIDAEPNITLLTTTTIDNILKDNNNQITAITTNHGTTVTTNVVVDATEYGDVIIKTEPNYRLGNGTKQNPSTNACIQDITYLAVIKRYPQGVPTELKITTPPPGYDQNLPGFRQIVTQNGSSSLDTGYPINLLVHTGYRGMPNSSDPNDYNGFSNNISKTGVNWANDYPINSTQYLTDKNYRQQINCEAKLKTLQFIYYLQTELSQSDWSVSTDEGYNTPYNTTTNSCPNIPSSLKKLENNLPVMPYVRESVRGIGSLTLTAKDIKRQGNPAIAQRNFLSSIAIGDYPNDLHNCRSNQTLEQDLESVSDASESGPFQVPLESLISTSTNGLIYAEKNISQSRLTNGATRLQPITMLTGQAAGALAALASQRSVNPTLVPHTLVQRELLKANSPLFLYNDVKPGSFGFSAIHTLTGLGIFSGSSRTQFNPDSTLTRDHAAVILLKAKYGPAYTPPQPTNNRFSDISSSSWAYAWVNQLASDGIASGCSATTFCPSSPVTRAQLAIFLLRTIEGSSYNPPPATGIFNDVPTTHYASSWIEELKRRNITSGCGNSNFCPDSEVTRAQAAILILTAIPDLGVHKNTSAPASPTIPPLTIPTPPPSTLATTRKPGDLNNDGTVNFVDFNLLISSFGNPYTIVDFNNIVSNYGK